ncbi:MAG: hypothetical protein HQ567_04085 [Candidatus Nealsonbacteria bacterium]|nr:hypothetical protein [Candidatus Nealsonbacteria bacterium]
MKPPPTGLPDEGDSLKRAARSARLGRARRRLLGRLIGDAAVLCLLKSRTKIDVGAWFFKRRVWTCLTHREMLLFATGKRPYLERIPLQQLHGSQYNHVTGQLVLAPVESTRTGGLKLSPLEGLDILSHIRRGDKPK